MSGEFDDVEPAPDVDVLVKEGGNGDVFLRFVEDEGEDEDEDNRRVELLNKDDVLDLYDQLEETEVIQNERS